MQTMYDGHARAGLHSGWPSTCTTGASGQCGHAASEHVAPAGTEKAAGGTCVVMLSNSALANTLLRKRNSMLIKVNELAVCWHAQARQARVLALKVVEWSADLRLERSRRDA